MSGPLIEAVELTRRFVAGGGSFGRYRAHVALDRVSFAIGRGEAIGIVGESGCGKSTLARLLVALDRPDAGSVLLEGRDLHRLPPGALARLRRRFGVVFQDPAGSFDPRRSVGWSVGDPLLAQGLVASRAEAGERVAAALAEVGIDPDAASRRPAEFSGG
ncbi:MAG: ATP-binding cassette domain-containing protein, partial [Burkholderiaceae bacterium]|nr:ATP-binding cassette domain-containing protein [Burkholderiaceae bacterium]